jgi:hypothetical protein
MYREVSDTMDPNTEKCNVCGETPCGTQRACELQRLIEAEDEKIKPVVKQQKEDTNVRLLEQKLAVAKAYKQALDEGTPADALHIIELHRVGQVLVREPTKQLFQEFVDNGYLKPKAELDYTKFAYLVAKCAVYPPTKEFLKYVETHNAGAVIAIGNKLLELMTQRRDVEGKG